MCLEVWGGVTVIYMFWRTCLRKKGQWQIRNLNFHLQSQVDIRIRWLYLGSYDADSLWMLRRMKCNVVSGVQETVAEFKSQSSTFPEFYSVCRHYCCCCFCCYFNWVTERQLNSKTYHHFPLHQMTTRNSKMEIVNKIDESTRLPLLIWPCCKFHSPVGLLLFFCSCIKGCMQINCLHKVKP